ncbi:ABC-type multidrug transport system, ATPase and permease component [Anaerobranca californiensis DSM 14826]|uniref:ABC-type multidrug transport system, ATPase and permease component n=1 Tax=Anaerobranca californiensis DSM 14826 TaxID=1120989 RepID=A0A1M6PYH5_9FIRM|nr:ABC transporter ATP-binding protein [Anaerobranca californiensis]SHK13014.1 ABC-type multidrug transport system, ATPase and permease component [Anaerobranca californiensis DSM 14826]
MKGIKKFMFLWNLIPKKEKFYYTVYSVISIIHVLIFLYLPFLYRDVINLVMEEVYLSEKVLLYIALTVIGYLSIKLWSLVNIFVTEKLTKEVLDQLFRTILKMDFKKFNSKDPGYWASVFSTDVSHVSQLFNDFIYTLPAELIMFSVIVVILFVHNIPLTLVILVLLLLITLMSLYREKKIIPHYHVALENLRKTSEKLNSYLKGMEDLIHYNSIKFLEKKYIETFSNYTTTFKKYLFKDFFNETVVKFLNEAGKVVVIGIVLRLFIKGNFDFGTALMLITFSNICYNKAGYLVENLRWLQSFPPHIEKIQEIVDSPKILDQFSKIDNDNFKELILEDVTFSYGYNAETGENNVLTAFNLRIQRGEKIAILGASGTGKTTLLRIIANFLKPQRGKVIFKDTRPKVGILFQGGRYFNRTLKDNLLIVKENATEGEMLTALKKAGLDQWFLSLPKGLETKIGQDGKLISGGERSRLSIAKLILFDPEFILLDEPLVGVDEGKKEEILETLMDFLKDKTCILVSHDKNLFKIVDKTLGLKEEIYNG